MADLRSAGLEAVRWITKAMKSMKMYSPKHPSVQQELTGLGKALEECHKLKEFIFIGTEKDALIVHDAPIEDKSIVIKQFVQTLRGKHIGSFVIAKGVPQSELQSFAEILVMKDEDVVREDKIDPTLIAAFKFVKVNEIEIHFSLTQEEEAKEEDVEVTDDGLPAKEGEIDLEATPRRKKLDDLVGTVFARQSKDVLSALEGPLAELGYTVLAGMLNQVSNLVEESGDSMSTETIGGIFEAMLGRMGSSRRYRFDDLHEGLRKTIMTMNPQAQKALFGSTFSGDDRISVLPMLQRLSPRFRGNVLAHEINLGEASPDKLREMLGTMAPSGADLVDMTAATASELVKSGGGFEQGGMGMSRLFSLLMGGVQFGTPPGLVLVVDDDENQIAEYRKLLGNAGYLVAAYASGLLAWSAMEKRRTFDLVVMEVKLPGKSGLDILQGLYFEKIDVPVIVCTKYPAFKDDFNIVTYPKIEFFTKPFHRGRFMKAVKTMVPSKADARKESAEDLQRAREIQEKLLPTSLPEIYTYDLSMKYMPAREVGGDYLDFLRIGDHKYAVIIADVSGKGIPAAMVMVMVRSVFRMIAGMGLSPRETVIRANKLITKDIRRGMFVTAVYAVFDSKERNVVVANAGHNPPLLWNKGMGLSQFLDVKGMALGLTDSPALEDSIVEETVTLETNDLLLLYTDGVVEAKNANDDEFGEGKLCHIINANAEKRSPDLISEVVKAVANFRGAAAQSDDITMFALRSEGEAPAGDEDDILLPGVTAR